MAAPETGRLEASFVSTPARGLAEIRLERLKQRFLKPALTRIQDMRLATELRWAAQEAAALAWVTPFPLLFFPALFEEKVQTAKARWKRQEEIRRRTALPLRAAA